jgi:3-hydroxy-9,10-secoandrosta-1,3,5(10)-triene-9,17-dione monooxygenase reductase component
MTEFRGDAATYRHVLGHFATGVVAITALDPATGRPTGLAANSFSSVSLDPPLVSFCVGHTSTSWPRVRAAGRFCINVLAEHQHHVCVALARSGGDKFEGLSWSESPAGCPLVDEAAAWLEVTLEAEYAAGDHVIVVARVEALEAYERPPLLFFRGGYGRLAD